MMLAPSLARVINTMQNLEQLAIELPEDKTDAFTLECWRMKVRLPLVRELIIGDMCGFVVDACPNVKEIKNWHGPHSRKVSDAFSWPKTWRLRVGTALDEESLDFIEALGRAPKLEVFSKRDVWSSTFLQGEPPVTSF